MPPGTLTSIYNLRAEAARTKSADRIALIRWDLARCALAYDLHCAEWMIRRAQMCEEWSCVMRDLSIVARRDPSNGSAHPASVAAGFMAADDTEGALVCLALSRGLSVSREEMANARR